MSELIEAMERGDDSEARNPPNAGLYSEEGRYRFDLQWRWGDGQILVGWLLNPSIATEIILDQSVRRIMVEAERLRLDGFRIINLYALRSKEVGPALHETAPIRDANEARTLEALGEAARANWPVVAGWGEHGRHKQDWALVAAHEAGVDLHRFGGLNNGHKTPQHSSRRRGGDALVRWDY